MSRNFNNYVKAFADMPSLVMTEKLDGQNNCFKESGVYARSHAAPRHKPIIRSCP